MGKYTVVASITFTEIEAPTYEEAEDIVAEEFYHFLSNSKMSNKVNNIEATEEE